MEFLQRQKYDGVTSLKWTRELQNWVLKHDYRNHSSVQKVYLFSSKNDLGHEGLGQTSLFPRERRRFQFMDAGLF
jgi:hypothetical protein